MAGKTRLISAPAAGGRSATGNWKQLQGSMGAIAPETMTTPTPTSGKFESPPDVDWERTVAQREAAEGLPRMAAAAPPVNVGWGVAANTSLMRPVVEQEPSDFSSLPDKFAIEIERKGERWKVTAPGVHSGLWKSGEDLPGVVEEALDVLSEMMRLDGPVPVAKRGRKTR